MSETDGLLIYMGNDGVFREYNQRNDIIIHCDSEEDRKHLMKKLERVLNSGWIPCSERLPEDEQIVIVDIGSDYGNRRYLFAYYTIDDYMDCWRNANTGFLIWCSVIAWMPLPEQYKENEDEGQADT